MRFEGLDLNLLVALNILLEERNVTLAARRLHISQSALSGALARLREYFGDELLVPVGRAMVPTPRAESLAEPVRAVLLQVRSSIASKSQFDPATSERRFNILTSDYLIAVLLGEVIRRASLIAPGVGFDVQHVQDRPIERLERGEVDLLITPEPFTSDAHPFELLFQDDHVVIAAEDNPAVRVGLDLERFLELGQVGVRFGSDRMPAYEDWVLTTTSHRRRLEVVASSFTAVPFLVAGTGRIALLPRRLASHFARLLPLKIFAAPIELPPLREVMQWNRFNDQDPGLRWLLGLLRETAAQELPSGAEESVLAS